MSSKRSDAGQRSMTIGALAERAGVNVQTVRYYERRGLLAAPQRTPSGYRVYSDDTLDRLRFIRRAQELGFTLTEIEELLVLRLDPRTTASVVKARAEAKIADVDRRIHDLERIKHALTQIRLGSSSLALAQSQLVKLTR